MKYCTSKGNLIFELASIQDTDLVRRVRARALGNVEEDKEWDRALEKYQSLDLKTLAFAFPSHLEFREILVAENIVGEVNSFLGYAVALMGAQKAEAVYEYVCLLLYDRSTFEAVTMWDNIDETLIYRNGKLLGRIVCVKKQKTLFGSGSPYRMAWELWKNDVLFGKVRIGGHIFFGKIYSKTYVAADSLYIERVNKPSLPIRIARIDKITDVPKILFRILTLAPLWQSKKTLLNTDTVIPATAPELEDATDTIFYFAVNVVFRTLFFDLAFSKGGGD
jgi:hypothetical protein